MENISDHIDIHPLLGKHDYFPLWDLQKEWVSEIDQQNREQALLLLEHNHVYTFGRGAQKDHLLISREKCVAKGIELAEVDRGGDITYHGPGQLVGYPLIYLNQLRNDSHLYLRKLEETLIQTLALYKIKAHRKEQYTGVWVNNEKIAAIGIKFNRRRANKGFITSHGFALNVNTDLSMFTYIIPCGITEYGVTSMEKVLGYSVNIKEVQQRYQVIFCKEFGLKPIVTDAIL